MRLIITLFLITLPFFEIWGLFKLGAEYGWWFFGYIVVMAILGWQLIQDEKMMVIPKLVAMMSQGGNLISGILGSAKNLLAGALFLFPGVITDLIGIVLLLIPVQASLNQNANPFQQDVHKKNDDIIEGEYRREDD
ncbi:MAG: FxsA family protein [Proteobacteria bacterium]|jgi:UPF0716 protein FxsA|nr:FxsA family protein [Pseudomonadota bacterium]MDA0872379.1 FxsA family protein [Pseudomonadota bacterium]MDA1134043.1 FxsA family protein [Pseudomonadota bacterium]